MIEDDYLLFSGHKSNDPSSIMLVYFNKINKFIILVFYKIYCQIMFMSYKFYYKII